jgi:hypothetical protein
VLRHSPPSSRFTLDRWYSCQSPKVHEILAFCESKLEALPSERGRFIVNRDWYDRFARRHFLTLKKPTKNKIMPKRMEECRTRFLRFGIRYQRRYGEGLFCVGIWVLLSLFFRCRDRERRSNKNLLRWSRILQGCELTRNCGPNKK